AAAGARGQWPLARGIWETLVAHAPAAAAGARVPLAEALLHTGATAQARALLERAVAEPGADQPRAMLLLAGLQDAAGDRERARGLWRRVVQLGQGETAAEAAYRLGRSLAGADRHADAIEWYLTAVYVGDRTPWAPAALLDAGRSFTALDQPSDALAAYAKVVHAQPEADAATRGEAAYLAAEILYQAGLDADALQMFALSATLTAGSPTEPRALVGALRSFVATGDRAAAERVYQRLLAAQATDRAVLTEARRALDRDDAAQSALPTERGLGRHAPWH
ncbi:MAG TPA: tetratricopeptide repeat protein, partial [Methylomirabilota bacterium]|nr:tetratricopeptide repeat protein [Methylomirabilota bacterium]